MCVDKVVKRPEDPFTRLCESVTYGKSRNVVNVVDDCDLIFSTSFMAILLKVNINIIWIRVSRLCFCIDCMYRFLIHIVTVRGGPFNSKGRGEFCCFFVKKKIVHQIMENK